MDMFEENGIEIPTTWDEFIAVCDTFKEKGITPLNFPLKDGVGPVSYTHLDVYKRQILGMRRFLQTHGK